MMMRNILQDGVSVGRKNILIFAPVFVSSVVVWLLTLITVGRAGMQVMHGRVTPDTIPGSMGASFFTMAIAAVIGAIITMIAHGMTVQMVGRSLDGNQIDLKQSWSKTVERIVPLLVASAIVGVLFGIGVMLLVLPGLVVAFLLMFTFVGVMVDELGAFEALGKSLKIVKSRTADCVIFFLLLIAIGFVFGLVNMIFGRIPIFGQLVGMVVSAVFAGYSSILLVIAYREFQEPVVDDDSES